MQEEPGSGAQDEVRSAGPLPRRRQPPAVNSAGFCVKPSALSRRLRQSIPRRPMSVHPALALQGGPVQLRRSGKSCRRVHMFTFSRHAANRSQPAPACTNKGPGACASCRAGSDLSQVRRCFITGSGRPMHRLKRLLPALHDPGPRLARALPRPPCASIISCP